MGKSNFGRAETQMAIVQRRAKRAERSDKRPLVFALLAASEPSARAPAGAWDDRAPCHFLQAVSRPAGSQYECGCYFHYATSCRAICGVGQFPTGTNGTSIALPWK